MYDSFKKFINRTDDVLDMSNITKVRSYFMYQNVFFKTLTNTDGITEIGNYAFTYVQISNFGLETENYFKNVTYIGEGAFRNNYTGKPLRFSDKLVFIGSSAFVDQSNSSTPLVTTESFEIDGDKGNKILSNCTFNPAASREAGSFANSSIGPELEFTAHSVLFNSFQNAKKLVKVTVHMDVDEPYQMYNTFVNCTSLTEAVVGCRIQDYNTYRINNGCLFTGCTALKKITFENDEIINTTTMFHYISRAGENLPALEDVYFPKVTSIGSAEFLTCCNSTTRVHFPMISRSSLTVMAGYPWGNSGSFVCQGEE